eukprot:GAFH01003451.1.p1 GENE.GAFH01003451.1~~GAFH01003451.1.p1  ORF type:complete len:181 (+),score=56.17 GAFH01003451.1:46-543(+)
MLGNVRTEYTSPHLFSIRINDAQTAAAEGKVKEVAEGDPAADPQQATGAAPGGGQTGGLVGTEFKKIAYLADSHSVRILDLLTGLTQTTVVHTAKIDWLELNPSATRLLFRDKRRQLHLYNLAKDERHTLLSSCSYCQWAPESDVVVAQNLNNLCVWYNVYAPTR